MEEKWVVKLGLKSVIEARREGDEDCWYAAKMLEVPREKDRVYIQYERLMSELKSKRKSRYNKSRPLKAYVKDSDVRLSPPFEDHEDVDFDLGGPVDAFHEGRWLEGTIKRPVVYAFAKKFVVSFSGDKGEEVEEEFETWKLRRSMIWNPPGWLYKDELLRKFPKKSKVEVRGDEEGFSGAWFTATIVTAAGKNSYVVEYQHLKTEDGTKLLKKTVDSEHIRPFPPEVSVETFSLDDEVDAWRDNGWWVGLISSVLEGPKYIVYFPYTNENNEFEPCDLRCHQEWIDGEWIKTS